MLFHGPSLTIVCQWGNFGALLCPRVQLIPHCGVCSRTSLIASSNLVIHMFLRNSRSELRLQVGRNVKSMGFFGRFFAHCTIIVHPIAYKRYSTPFLNKPHDLTPLHGSVTNGVGGVANRSFVQKKKIISMQDNSDALPLASTTN